MNILIMGPAGSGKGTMSQYIVDEFQLTHISTGDIFRSEIGQQTELGLLAKGYMDKGLLVPDEVTNKMVASYLEKNDNPNGYLLDGYPRSLPQAEAFQVLTAKTKYAIDKVIELKMDFDKLIERITGRRLCRGCGTIYHIKTMPSKVEGVCDICGEELYQRKDDTKEGLQVRLDEYNKQTIPVIDFYRSKGIVETIQADRSKEAVWKDLKKILEELQ